MSEVKLQGKEKEIYYGRQRNSIFPKERIAEMNAKGDTAHKSVNFFFIHWFLTQCDQDKLITEYVDYLSLSKISTSKYIWDNILTLEEKKTCAEIFEVLYKSSKEMRQSVNLTGFYPMGMYRKELKESEVERHFNEVSAKNIFG